MRQAKRSKINQVQQPRDIAVAEHRVVTASPDETVFKRAEQTGGRLTVPPQPIGQEGCGEPLRCLYTAP